MITGIITGCSALVLCLVALGIYAIWQKRRAEQAIGLSRPFGKSNAPKGEIIVETQLF